ncbi:MAG: HAD family hydrolase [Clostridiales bacterium GWF2_36_10]|nr:MAG: HAD family hydrolase [Clostridiales bacterium GWF2_36_10]HAN21239.1 HAD family hydrolase [Clostridiales bacterium]
MTSLTYPFDSSYILKNRKAIRKELLSDGSNRLKKRIAILGGSTTSDIVKITELFLLNNGIEPTFYESEYGQFREDALFGNEELEAFKPDLIYIHTTLRNLKLPFPTLSDSEAEVLDKLNQQYRHFEVIWEKLQEKFGCPIIQNNFEYPFYRLLGNRDAYDIRGKINYVNRLNELFYNYARTHEGFYINDINYLSSCYGLDKWADLSYWYMYKYALCIEAIPYLSFNISNIIKSVFGKNKKLLVLDMDNTLWGGVIGDDGVEGIELGQETANGQCYREFQDYIKSHKDLGVMLTIASKNERENALLGINHPDSAFNEDDFLIIKSNWENKAKNISETAAELDLGADSFVFVDDNPAEREIVGSVINGIAVPEMVNPEEYIRTLDKNAYFEVTSFSQDDLKRNEMYMANASRAVLMQDFTDYREYLLGLDMHGEIQGFIPVYIQRITQLTNKSNQFNVTTKRYTVSEIEAAASSDEYITLYGRLEDKFGDNGVVSVVIGKKDKDILNIDLWLMSCRVLKRDMELAMLDTLVKKCREQGIKRIVGYYFPTSKNAMVKDLFGFFGFNKVSENENGNTVWELSVDAYENKNNVIKVIS